MVSSTSSRSWRGLNHIQTVHVHLTITDTPIPRELASISNACITATSEIRVKRKNYLCLRVIVESVVSTSVGINSSLVVIIPIYGFILMPLGLWEPVFLSEIIEALVLVRSLFGSKCEAQHLLRTLGHEDESENFPKK